MNFFLIQSCSRLVLAPSAAEPTVAVFLGESQYAETKDDKGMCIMESEKAPDGSCPFCAAALDLKESEVLSCPIGESFTLPLSTADLGLPLICDPSGVEASRVEEVPDNSGGDDTDGGVANGTDETEADGSDSSNANGEVGAPFVEITEAGGSATCVCEQCTCRAI